MPSLILIDKSGKLKSVKTDGLDIHALCKKCGFKSIDGFVLANTWSVSFNDIEYKLCLYGKTTGRANSENKYEFPPPMDNTLFFGSCVVLNVEDGVVSDMSVKEFSDIMEHLYGGFDDVGSDEEEDAESIDDIILPKTKDGYVKDDFVVDSDEEEDDDFDSDEDIESEEEEIIVAPKPKVPAKVKLPAAKKEKAAAIIVECSDELTEEEYLPM
jgi:hypothetical protein